MSLFNNRTVPYFIYFRYFFVISYDTTQPPKLLLLYIQSLLYSSSVLRMYVCVRSLHQIVIVGYSSFKARDKKSKLSPNQFDNLFLSWVYSLYSPDNTELLCHTLIVSKSLYLSFFIHMFLRRIIYFYIMLVVNANCTRQLDLWLSIPV